MTLLIALTLVFEPAFVFPGETFAVKTAQDAFVTSDDVRFTKSDRSWVGVAPTQPAEVWATIGPPGAYTDATVRTLPVASGPPMTVGDLSIVPLHRGAYGAILGGKRFADFALFELAARGAPLRKREFRVTSIYRSPNRITLYGDAGGVLQLVITAVPEKVQIAYTALFDVRGSMTVLGTPLHIPQSSPGTISYEIRMLTSPVSER